MSNQTLSKAKGRKLQALLRKMRVSAHRQGITDTELFTFMQTHLKNN